MTHASRYRSRSPGRWFIDPLRSSTGTVPEDFYTSPTSYHGPDYDSYDGYLSPKTAERRGGFFSVDNADRLEAHPISTKTYRDGNHATRLKTSYAMRPRSRTTVESNQRPLNLYIAPTTSSSRKPPVVSTAYNRSPSPLPPQASHGRDEQERYMYPATSGRARTRVCSWDYTSDSGARNSAMKNRPHKSHHVYRPARGSRYHDYGDPQKWDDSRHYDAYSYTDARETFEKESAARISQRNYSRVGRPKSMMATSSALIRPAHHKESKRLPSAYRSSDRPLETERLRITNGRDYHDSDAHRDHQRYPHQQRLIVHQDREDGYQSFTDDQKHSSRHRHRSRPRESRKKRAEDFLAPVLGGLASLGLASGYSDDGRDADRSSRSHRARDIGLHDDRDFDQYVDRSRERGAISEDERVRHRRHRHRHRDHSHRLDSSPESNHSEIQAHSNSHRSEKFSSRKKHDSSSSESSHHRRSPDNSDKSLPATKEDGSKRSVNDDKSAERSRKPVAVEPPIVKEPEAPPKSILKTPREKFPEDETHMREGVAPLKDAQKNGIPPGARWTKIDRRLVNPAALEAGHERFEERAEYVIVLRVLTKEEIQAYAVKTQEIRGTALSC